MKTNSLKGNKIYTQIEVRKITHIQQNYATYMKQITHREKVHIKTPKESIRHIHTLRYRQIKGDGRWRT